MKIIVSKFTMVFITLSRPLSLSPEKLVEYFTEVNGYVKGIHFWNTYLSLNFGTLINQPRNMIL